jgi:putative transposase
MDGCGRALDNGFIERPWRSVKYEDAYLKDYASVPELAAGLERYFHFYNHQRPHQSLAYRTPAEVHCDDWHLTDWRHRNDRTVSYD